MPIRTVEREEKRQTFEEYKAALDNTDGLGGVYAGSYADGRSPNEGLTRERYEKEEKDERKLSFVSVDTSRIVSVKSNLKSKIDRDRHEYSILIISERHEAHPTGEIYIADNKTVHEVACTPKIIEKIRELELVIVE